MLLCDFCNMANCDGLPWELECEWGEGHGDEDAVIAYAKEHGISVSDAIALIKFCSGLR